MRASMDELYRIADCLQRGAHTEAVDLCYGGDFPYGLWQWRDGREVLFDRNYDPLWKREPDGIIELATSRDTGYSVNVNERFFFIKSGNPDHAWHRQYAGMKQLREVLIAWGLIRRSRRERAALAHKDRVRLRRGRV